MNISEITSIVIKGVPILTFPLKNDNGWIFDMNGHHVLDVRGWIHFRLHPEGKAKAEKIHQAVGDWIVTALNKTYEDSIQFENQPL